MKTISLIAFTALALAAGGAHAQANTGSLAGWQALGDASAAAGRITLTTAYTPDEAGNLSGSNPVPFNTLTSAMGVAATALDLPGEEATEGSLVKQSFAVLAGQTLSFNWSFSTLDDLYQDHAFVVLGGQVTTLATRAAPGAAVMSFSRTFAQAGNVELSVGVVDTYDADGVSTLRISNLQLSPVPEPASWALLLLGAGVVARRVHARAQSRLR